MAKVQAFCRSCGTSFSTPFSLGKGLTLQIEGLTFGPCPSCGQPNGVADGTYYTVAGNIVRLIQENKPSAAALDRLTKIATDAHARRVEPEEVDRQINEQAPEAKEIWDLLIKNRADIYALLSLLLAILTYCSTSRDPVNLTRDEIAGAVEAGVRAATQQTQAPQQNGSSGLQRKFPLTLLEGPGKDAHTQSRNSTCSCGSGEKFKRCCGSSEPSPAKRLIRKGQQNRQ